MKSVTVKLDYVTDIAFAKIIIAATTTHVHPNS